MNERIEERFIMDELKDYHLKPRSSNEIPVASDNNSSISSTSITWRMLMDARLWRWCVTSAEDIGVAKDEAPGPRRSL